MMNEQQQLMTAILKTDCSFDIDEKGLAVYKRNLHANAMRALEISFPTVEQLLGAELFAYCVEQLLLTSPPGSGDWGTWGREFSALLSQLPALDDYPYVADMATLDYSLHVLNRAKDFSVELSSMSLLASHDLDHVLAHFLRVLHGPLRVSCGFPEEDCDRADEIFAGKPDHGAKGGGRLGCFIF